MSLAAPQFTRMTYCICQRKAISFSVSVHCSPWHLGVYPDALVENQDDQKLMLLNAMVYPGPAALLGAHGRI